MIGEDIWEDIKENPKQSLVLIIIVLIIIICSVWFTKVQWDSCMQKFPRDWLYCWKHIS